MNMFLVYRDEVGYVDAIDFAINMNGDLINILDNEIMGVDYRIERCTGKKDHLGNYIYEGDVFFDTGISDIYGYKVAYRNWCIVSWSEDKLAFVYEMHCGEYLLSECNSRDIVVEFKIHDKKGLEINDSRKYRNQQPV